MLKCANRPAEGVFVALDSGKTRHEWEALLGRKHQTPNSNTQGSFKLQSTKPAAARFWGFKFGASLVLGGWCLVLLGASLLGSSASSCGPI